MMKCEKCGGRGNVYLSRHKDNGTVYRRRKCQLCGHSWTTVELDVLYMKGIISDITRIMNDLRKR